MQGAGSERYLRESNTFLVATFSQPVMNYAFEVVGSFALVLFRQINVASQ